MGTHSKVINDIISGCAREKYEGEMMKEEKGRLCMHLYISGYFKYFFALYTDKSNYAFYFLFEYLFFACLML